MHREEIINTLKKRIEEEKEDVTTYKILAEECDRNGWRESARVLHDIAHDESTHVIFISKMLEEYTERS